MSRRDHATTPLTSAADGDELALRIGELDLFMLAFGIAIVLALVDSGSSSQSMVSVSPSGAGVSGNAGYVDKPIVVTVTPAGLEIANKLVAVSHKEDLTGVAGRPVLVQPEHVPEVDRLLGALSALRDAGAAVHVVKNQER